MEGLLCTWNQAENLTYVSHQIPMSWIHYCLHFLEEEAEPDPGSHMAGSPSCASRAGGHTILCRRQGVETPARAASGPPAHPRLSRPAEEGSGHEEGLCAQEEGVIDS